MTPVFLIAREFLFAIIFSMQTAAREKYKTQIVKMAEAIDKEIELEFPANKNFARAMIMTQDALYEKIIEADEIEGLRHDRLMEPSSSLAPLGIKGWHIIAAKLEGLSKLAGHFPNHLE